MSNPNELISWLKYLDIEYLDDASCKALSSLDINNPSDQPEIIRIAMKNEIMELNEISLSSMKKILYELENFSDLDIESVMENVEMPFHCHLHNYRGFFKQVKEYFFN